MSMFLYYHIYCLSWRHHVQTHSAFWHFYIDDTYVFCRWLGICSDAESMSMSGGRHGIVMVSCVNWCAGPRFTNCSSIAFQIRRKFRFTLISSLIEWSLQFCTWHDSCAVVACAKNFRDLMASNGITARRNFHRIWIAGKKPLVKWAPGVF